MTIINDFYCLFFCYKLIFQLVNLNFKNIKIFFKIKTFLTIVEIKLEVLNKLVSNKSSALIFNNYKHSIINVLNKYVKIYRGKHNSEKNI